MDQPTSAQVTHVSPHCGARRTYHNLTNGCSIICSYCHVAFTYHATPQDIAAETLRACGLNAVVNDDAPSFVSVIYPQPVYEPHQTCPFSGIVHGGYNVRGFDSRLNTKVETIDAFVDRVANIYHELFPADTTTPCKETTQ